MYKIPIKNKKTIESILKKRNLENFDRITEIESALKNKRGYIFKIPPPYTPVICPFSGGLDSVIVSAYLMSEYKLIVYPIYLERGHPYDKYEIKAAKNYEKILLKKYPHYMKPMRTIRAKFPLKPFYHQNRNLNYFFSNLMLIYLVQLCYQIQVKENVKIRNIFLGIMRHDGENVEDETLTAVREGMNYICNRTQDFDWQITSLPIEKEIGFFHYRDYFIRWATKNKIRLDKTRSSCHQNTDYHCGECDKCKDRKLAFKKAKVEDLTVYKHHRKKRQKKFLYKMLLNTLSIDLKTLEKIEEIPGWLMKNEINALYSITKELLEQHHKNQNISELKLIEIGSWLGKSTTSIAFALKDFLSENNIKNSNIKVISIDPHQNTVTHSRNKISNSFKLFKKNIKNNHLSELITPLKLYSHEAFLKKQDLKSLIVFIDGSHRYKNVRDDVNMWSQTIIEGGCLLLHDTLNHKGPRKVFFELMWDSRFSYIGNYGDLACFTKVKKLTIKNILKKIYSYLLLKILSKTIFIGGFS